MDNNPLFRTHPPCPMNTAPLLTDLPALNAEECAFWTAQVLALRPHWTRRDAQLPFYTLGLAAYLDAVKGDPLLGGQQAYHHKLLRQENNRLLHTHFAPLLERCCEVLAQWSGQPAACVGEQAALPGINTCAGLGAMNVTVRSAGAGRGCPSSVRARSRCEGSIQTASKPKAGSCVAWPSRGPYTWPGLMANSLPTLI